MCELYFSFLICRLDGLFCGILFCWLQFSAFLNGAGLFPSIRFWCGFRLRYNLFPCSEFFRESYGFGGCCGRFSDELVYLLVFRHGFDEISINDFFTLGKTVYETQIADPVDQARYAITVLVNKSASGIIKQLLRSTGFNCPVFYIFSSLFLVERFQVIVDSDTLGKLLQLRLLKLCAQFVLTNQDNL